MADFYSSSWNFMELTDQKEHQPLCEVVLCPTCPTMGGHLYNFVTLAANWKNQLDII